MDIIILWWPLDIPWVQNNLPCCGCTANAPICRVLFVSSSVQSLEYIVVKYSPSRLQAIIVLAPVIFSSAIGFWSELTAMNIFFDIQSIANPCGWWIPKRKKGFVIIKPVSF